ncbi:MAG: hypothetical protein P9L98_02675 [Candidatus Kaelpia imicola]|nr:hypothetical protein [Candidatus Kaelpia imicola]
MNISVFIAKLLGPCFSIIALGIIFNPKFYQKMMEDFTKSSASIYFGGLFALLFGLLVVLFHNLWVRNWTVIITIFGWSGLVKGIWLILFPGSVSKFMQIYKNNSILLKIHSVLILALGITLTIFGYLLAV